MSEEVKERLNPNFSVSEKYENMIETATSIIKKHLSNNEDCSKEVALAYDVKNYIPRLLDYITNLQEKYKEADKLYTKMICEYNKVLSRNEKAIEYIDNHLRMESHYGIQHPDFKGTPSYDFSCWELEDILRGDE